MSVRILNENSSLLVAKNISKYFVPRDCEGLVGILFNRLKKKQDIGVKEISLQLSEGCILGIVGGQKCGKTTLLKMLSGVLEISSGNIFFRGEPVHSESLKELAAYISREQSAFNDYTLTLFESMIQYACHDDVERHKLVDEVEKLLEDFKLDEYKFVVVNKLPNEIRKETKILRGLLRNRKILCFDQPFTYVTQGHRDKFIEYLRKYAASGKSIVISANFKDEIDSFCNEIIELNNKDS